MCLYPHKYILSSGYYCRCRCHAIWICPLIFYFYWTIRVLCFIIAWHNQKTVQSLSGSKLRSKSPTKITNKNYQQKLPTKITNKNHQQKSPTKIPNKNYQQKSPTKLTNKNHQQKWLSSHFSNDTAPCKTLKFCTKKLFFLHFCQ